VSLTQHALIQEQLGFYAVVTPPGYDAPENKSKRYPIVVIVQGSGADETEAAMVADSLGRDEVIYVIPRAPYPSGGEAAEGFTAIPSYPATWGAPDANSFPKDDLAQLDAAKLYTTQIAAAVKDARKRYRAAWGKLVVFGHGEGGTFAHQFAVHQPWMTKAYFASAGNYASTTDGKSGIAHAAAIKSNQIQAMIAHSESDAITPAASAKALVELFEKGRVKHTALILPDSDHTFGERVQQEAKLFVRHHCCGEPLAPVAPAPPPVPAAPAPEPAAAPAPAAVPAPAPAAVPAEPAPAKPVAPAPAAKPAPAKPAPVAKAPAAKPAPAKPAPVAKAPAEPAKPAPVTPAPTKPTPPKDLPVKATAPAKPAPPAATK
jgi:predicted esterase